MKTTALVTLLVLSVAMAACGPKRFHQGEMPDPGPYRVHFHELDVDNDEAVTWQEFASRFPDTTDNVFRAIDRSGDGIIDHDEWHMFKEAHGAEH